LLFPRGEYGWHWGRRLETSARAISDDMMVIDEEEEVHEGQRRQQQPKRLTQRAFYRFRLHVRNNESKIIFFYQDVFFNNM